MQLLLCYYYFFSSYICSRESRGILSWPGCIHCDDDNVKNKTVGTKKGKSVMWYKVVSAGLVVLPILLSSSLQKHSNPLCSPLHYPFSETVQSTTLLYPTFFPMLETLQHIALLLHASLSTSETLQTIALLHIRDALAHRSPLLPSSLPMSAAL